MGAFSLRNDVSRRSHTTSLRPETITFPASPNDVNKSFGDGMSIRCVGGSGSAVCSTKSKQQQKTATRTKGKYVRLVLKNSRKMLTNEQNNL